MLPDRVSNPGPLTYESGALPIAIRGPAILQDELEKVQKMASRFATGNYDLNSRTT